MTQPGETSGFTLEDHVRAIEKHSNIKLDLVIYPNDKIPDEIIKSYNDQASEVVEIEDDNHDFKLIKQDLLSYVGDTILHDHDLVSQGFEEIWEELPCRSAVK